MVIRIGESSILLCFRLQSIYPCVLVRVWSSSMIGGHWNASFETMVCCIYLLLQVPSMRQLHLHVISQDFDSKHLKHKKHWNSFTTAFFRDSVDVMEEVNNQGKATIQDEKRLMSMELRCHRCRSAHPNIPRLKSHISSCQASFPADLQKKGRLVPEQTNSGCDP